VDPGFRRVTQNSKKEAAPKGGFLFLYVGLAA